MLFVVMYLLVTVAGVVAGYPLLDSLYEGVSAASNSGLSCGLTSASMPWGLKWVYIVAMWLGRLEFLAAFVLLGYIGRWVFGR
jgi:trk system potassium uptake protein TrkH